MPFSYNVNHPLKVETQTFNTLAINGNVLGTGQYSFYTQKWVGPRPNTSTVEFFFLFLVK